MRRETRLALTAEHWRGGIDAAWKSLVDFVPEALSTPAAHFGKPAREDEDRKAVRVGSVLTVRDFFA